MRKLSYLLALSLGIAANFDSIAQCSVEAFPADTVFFTCGEEEEIELSAFGNSGNQVLDNDFNNGTAGSGWDATPAATFSNPCVASPDGSTYMWMGDATPQPRILTTLAFDLTPGGTICFEMRYSVQADAAPCEGPDLPEEGVHLQYSIDNGNTWTDINYFDPNGGNDPVLTTWQQYCYPIPPAAQTTNTKIRWFQDATSGAEYDHWGLDNVFITLNDPSYYYEWQHNMFVGQNPPNVTATNDTSYTVYYTNGIDDTCQATVEVATIPPLFSVSTIPDTSFCDNFGCVDLEGEANILIRPGSQPTFENNEFQPLNPIGQATVIPISVGGVEIDTVASGSVLSVCLNVNNPDLFPLNLSTLKITLNCPNGASVVLVDQGDLTGTSLTNTCFSSSATTNITNGTAPYTGTYLPSSGSLDDLVGCDINGVWDITITNSSLFGIGIFNSWDITFDVPEISYPGLYSWSPTTNLSNSNTLNPTACPTQSTTYTLTVQDSNFCAVRSHDVTVGIVSSNALQISASITDASCGDNNGAIDLQLSGNSGGETVEWSNGEETEDISGLAPNTYSVTVTDGCVKDTTFTVGDIPTYELNYSTVGASCDSSNGSIDLDISGNVVGTTDVQWSNGETTEDLSGLAPGSYTVTVSDNLCSEDTVIEVEDLPNLKVNADVIEDSCAFEDAKIELNVTNNSGSVNYDWDNGATTSSIENLGTGTYAVNVSDDFCEKDTMISITDLSGVQIDTVIPEQPNAGGSDGSLAIATFSGEEPFEYSIDNGATFQPDSVFQDLPAGTYLVMVQDDNGCVDTLTVVLDEFEEIFFPNVFNPSSDVTDNSTFVIKGLVGPEVVIYNRWGKKIFESDSYQNDWDGENYKDGVYYYVAKDKSEGKEYSGYVHLTRN